MSHIEKYLAEATLPFLPVLGELCQFGNISKFKKCKNSCWSNFWASQCVKIADFALLESQKLISSKIWAIENSWNVHTVQIKLDEINIWTPSVSNNTIQNSNVGNTDCNISKARQAKRLPNYGSTIFSEKIPSQGAHLLLVWG